MPAQVQRDRRFVATLEKERSAQSKQLRRTAAELQGLGAEADMLRSVVPGRLSRMFSDMSRAFRALLRLFAVSGSTRLQGILGVFGVRSSVSH